MPGSLRWSPDERSLLFVGITASESASTAYILLADWRAGTQRVVATERAAEIQDVAWSGETLFYLTYAEKQTRLMRLDASEPNAQPQLVARLDGEWRRILKVW